LIIFDPAQQHDIAVGRCVLEALEHRGLFQDLQNLRILDALNVHFVAQKVLFIFIGILSEAGRGQGATEKQANARKENQGTAASTHQDLGASNSIARHGTKVITIDNDRADSNKIGELSNRSPRFASFLIQLNGTLGVLFRFCSN
jgi:hypothetical protein